MNNEEKFVFDLQGYLIIKNVLKTDEVAELNEIIAQSGVSHENEKHDWAYISWENNFHFQNGNKY